MSLEFVKSVIGVEMQAVDAIIRTQLHSDVALIRQLGKHITGSGGKRLRPMLVLLAAQALGYRGENHLKLAAVIEFIHTSTLLHDDVVDESTLRRGRATANAVFGNAASILVGDFMYTRAFQLMVSCNSMRVMQVLADATNIIAEGEVLQLMNIGNVNIDETDYVRVIQYKTAKLFEAATRVGALLADAPDDVQDKLARYGMHLGTAFQIIDDVLDYSGKQDDIGKRLGDDLAEGKPTLPLIHTMRNGSPAQAAVVREALLHGQRDKLPDVLTAIQRSGALEYAHGVALTEATAARSMLADLPATPARQALEILAELAVDRDR